MNCTEQFAKTFFKSALAAMAAVVVGPSFAQQGLVTIAGSGGVNPPLERCLDLSIVGDYRGRLSPLYDSQAQVWVSSEIGEPYSLRIENKCSYRLLASIAVDGLNAVDGKTPGVGGAGYVINGYEVRTVSGWRTSLNEVARFYFTEPEQSYVFKTTGRIPSGLIELGVYVEDFPVQPNYLSVRPPSNGPTSFPTPGIVGSRPAPIERPSTSPRNPRPVIVGPPGNQRFAQPPVTSPTPSVNTGQQPLLSPEPRFSAQSSSLNQDGMSSGVGTGFGQALNSSVVVSDFKPSSVLPVLRQILNYGPLSQLNQMNLSPLRPNLPVNYSFGPANGFAAPPQ